MSDKINEKEEEEVDRISNLPGHIVGQILSLSSLRYAVQTSILSRNWRYKWVTIPSLVFDNESVLLSTTDKDKTLRKYKLVSIVDQVLLLHTGPIHKFELSHYYVEGGSDYIDKWILYLSRVATVKEFILNIFRGDRYKVPSSIYSCQNLTHLQLYKCVLKPPPTDFNGFKSLKCLDLQYITMEQLGFEKMISSCPLLERLTLMECDADADAATLQLNIHAPNLVYLDVECNFADICFTDTCNLLLDVSIKFKDYSSIVFVNETNQSCDNLIHFFTALPHIQRLKVKRRFLKYLADGGAPIPEKLPTTFLHLTFLSIHINFEDTKQNLAVLCLLRSSPNLQQLELYAWSEEQAPATTADNIVANFDDSFALNQLRLVKIVGISSLCQKLSFIEFLLQNSPLLQRMTVNPPWNVDDGFKWDLVSTELLRLPRASTSCQIVFNDPLRGKARYI